MEISQLYVARLDEKAPQLKPKDEEYSGDNILEVSHGSSHGR
jgi:hypothetical protein